MNHRRRGIAAGVTALGLVAAVGLTYANVFGNAWLFDDEFLVLKNTFLDSWTNLGRIFSSSSTAGAGFTDSFYRPMQGLAYLTVNQTFGRNAGAFHALNVGLHALNALGVWRLGRTLGLSRRGAVSAALLWAVHPLHVEAITYVSATADPLHAAFVLLALNLAVGRGPRSSARIAGALLAFVAGLLSKESAITLPALLAAVIFITDPRRWSWRAYRVTLPFWAVAAAYFGARRLIMGAAQNLSFFKQPNAYADHLTTRIWTALAALPSYAELLAWPHDLHMDREFPSFDAPAAPAVMLGAAMVLAATAVVWRARRRRTPGSILAAGSIAWIAAAHAPHSGVVLPVNSVFLEHWMYLTAVPVFWGAGSLLARVRPIAGIALTFAIALALAQKTWRQNEIWATPIRFFTHTLGYSPTSARIRHNLANAMLDAGRTDAALEQFELMIRAGTPYPATFHTAAHVYLQRRQFERAETYFLNALALDPKFYPSLQELAVLYELRGDRARGAEYQRRYEALRP